MDTAYTCDFCVSEPFRLAFWCEPPPQLSKNYVKNQFVCTFRTYHIKFFNLEHLTTKT